MNWPMIGWFILPVMMAREESCLVGFFVFLTVLFAPRADDGTRREFPPDQTEAALSHAT